MAPTGLVSDARYMLHETGAGHPERPSRLSSILEHLKSTGLASDLTPIEPRKADLPSIERVHPINHLETVRRASEEGHSQLDADTTISPRSYDVALWSVGGVLAACDAVIAGRVENAFCAVRPPGHHAETGRAMGFCLFNNVAIAARYLQHQHGIERVLILDWDVHHGNGTQEIFYADSSVFFASLHQYPWYPGTGSLHEKGTGAGEGRTLNVPMLAGAGDAEYLAAFETQVFPAIEIFRPQFVLISAGFDAHRDDPLSQTEVTEDGFARFTEWTKQLARTYAEGRIVSVLEGGYDLVALAKSVEFHLEKLKG